MFFSVIIPVFNCKDYLIEAVQSVLNQSFDDYEIVLVDDGSTDGSDAICDSLVSPKIHVTHQKNQGQYLARQKGIELAEGEYCLFLDADDKFFDNSLSQMFQILSLRSFDLLCFEYCRFDNSKITLDKEFVFDERIEFRNDDEFIKLKRKFASSDRLNSMCTKCVRTELLKNLQSNYNNNTFSMFGEDKIQSAYIIDVSKSVLYVNERLYMYRINEKSVTNSRKSFEQIKYCVGNTGYEKTLRDIYNRWGVLDDELVIIISTQRMVFLKNLFLNNYCGILSLKERKHFLFCDWKSLILADNFKHLPSLSLKDRILIKSIINRKFITCELIRVLYLLVNCRV